MATRRIANALRRAACCALLALVPGGCAGGKPPSEAPAQPAAAQEPKEAATTPKEAATTPKKAATTPKKTARPSSPAAGDWYDTPEGLARAVLEGLKKRDKEALWSLRVSQELYENELCPAFIADKPRHTLSVRFHWNLLKVKSLRELSEILGEYGGLPLELVELEKPEKIEDYETFKLWRRVRLKVRYKDTVKSIRVFGAIVERKGRFKLLAYDT
jgi:hypothetical protein